MTKSAEKAYVRCASVLLVLLFLLSALIVPAFAAQVRSTNEEHLVITGLLEEKFELSGNKSKLFHLEDIGPGDTWTGKIFIKNDTAWNMDISLLSIVSNIEDLVLFEALTLDITCDDEVLYSGSYSPDPGIIIAPRTMAPKTEQVWNVTVQLPIGVGNKLQSREMDATWTFEATSAATAGKPQTGHNLATENTAIFTVLWVILLALLATVIIVVRIRSVRKAQANHSKEVSKHEDP